MHPCKHPLGGAVILVVLLMFVGAVSLSQGARIVPVGEVVDILRGVPMTFLRRWCSNEYLVSCSACLRVPHWA